MKWHQESNTLSVVKFIAPLYPPIAAAARIEGNVIVELVIDSEGKVNSGSAVEGPILLRKASEEAAMRWEFSKSPRQVKERKSRLTFRYILIQPNSGKQDVKPVFKAPSLVEIRYALQEVQI
ncbi:MAG: energy transducer TonB [Acidobacteria bacterium]|nr:energy transducer TonB [Acidobacteriota bacterium]